MNRFPWTPYQDEVLTMLYPDTPTAAIAQRLRKTPSQVYGRAHKLGLKKSDAFLQQYGGRLTGGDSRGASTRFQKGHQTWNAGKSFHAGGRSAETQFQKGRAPQEARNYQPIGSFRISRDGLLEQKVTDDAAYPARRWVAYQRIVWERAHGPIPPGCVVAFLPGTRTTDPEQITADRLECITKAENMRRNTIHRYPPELKDVIRLQGKLKRKIHEKQN